MRTRPSAVELQGRDARELDLAGAGETGAVPGEGHADPRRAADPRPSGAASRGRCRSRLGGCARSRPRPDALELGGLRGALEDLLAGDALAQDLAGRGLVAAPVEVPAADVERG